MKIINIFCWVVVFGFMLSSCETEVIDPAGQRGVTSVPGIQNLNPATYDVNDLENTFVKFDVVLDDPTVDQAAILVSYKGDKKRAEVASVTSFPATLTIPLTEVAAKLGLQLSDIEAADVFNFEVKTTQGGQSYFSSAAFNVAVVCGYEVSNVTGSYRAVSGGWGVDGGITIEADPNDEYTLYVTGLATIDGLEEDQGPLKLIVDPLDFSVTAVHSVLASSTAPWGNPYTGLGYAGSGMLNTCDGSMDMLFTITVDQGSFGSFDFQFTKN